MFDLAGRFQPMITQAGNAYAQAAASQGQASAAPAPVNPNPNNPRPSVPQQAPSQPTGIPTPAAQPSPQAQQQLGMPVPRQQQMYQNFQPPPQQQQYQQPMQQQQSITQQVGRGGSQSVQNYLTALNQSGAGHNNANMNAPGQLGAQSNVGFSGMGQRQPGYGPTFMQQGYTGQMSAGPSQVYGAGPAQAYSGNVTNSQLGYQGNQAFAGPNYNIGNAAYQGNYGQMGSPQLENTGGVSTVNGPSLANGAGNAPQFQIPQPWLNPQNTPQNSKQWEGLFYNDPSSENYYNVDVNPNNPKQSGSFYSNQFETTSDVRAKENVNDAKGELQDFLDNLGVYSYEYKNKDHGDGRYISPMAQEFEKSKLGSQAVTENAEGVKMVNYGRLAGVQTAALALLNQKYNALEKKFNEALKDNMKKRGNRG